MLRKILVSSLGALLLGLSSMPAQAVPTLDNPGFTNGLTGWSYDDGGSGLITTSSNGAVPGSYALVSNGYNGQGATVAQAAIDLGITSASLNTYLTTGPFGPDPNFNATTSRLSLLYQSIGGTYDGSDQIPAYLNILGSSTSPNFTGEISYGYVDDVTHQIVGTGTTVPTSFLAFLLAQSLGGSGAGTDGYDIAAGGSGVRGSFGAIGTSNPATFFFLMTSNVVDTAPSTQSASAISFAPEVPEIDPGHAALPVAFAMGSFLLLLDRRRRSKG